MWTSASPYRPRADLLRGSGFFIPMEKRGWAAGAEV
jgi:hypothetical protein